MGTQIFAKVDSRTIEIFKKETSEPYTGTGTGKRSAKFPYGTVLLKIKIINK